MEIVTTVLKKCHLSEVCFFLNFFFLLIYINQTGQTQICQGFAIATQPTYNMMQKRITFYIFLDFKWFLRDQKNVCKPLQEIILVYFANQFPDLSISHSPRYYYFKPCRYEWNCDILGKKNQKEKKEGNCKVLIQKQLISNHTCISQDHQFEIRKNHQSKVAPYRTWPLHITHIVQQMPVCNLPLQKANTLKIY